MTEDAATAAESYGLDPDEAMGAGDGPWIPLADPGAAQGPLSGIWLSRYSFVSGSRDGAEFTSGHYVVLIQSGSKLQVRSLPDTAAGRVAMDLTVNGQVVTGTWTEQTDPDGHYSGATYHGALQMIADETGDRMSGAWAGYGRDRAVNTGPWTLERVASPVSPEAIEEWNKPVPAE